MQTDSFRFGGNTNGVNTYQGVDVATLTGGVYTPEDLLNPKNFGCMVYQVRNSLLHRFGSRPYAVYD